MRSVLLLAFLLAGCERAGESIRTTAPEPSPARVRDDDTFARVEGRGATEDEAYAKAVRELATKLLGDPRWLDVVPVDLHERPAQLDAEALPGGGVKVRLAVTHSEAAASLAAFRDTQPSVAAPEPWRDTIFAYLAAHASEHACVRQRELFAVACETGTTDDADAALRGLAEAVVLAPTLRGGVPLDGSKRPLRPPGVVALWNGAPVSAVPLRVAVGDAVVRSFTGDDGRLELESPASWPVTVDIDTELLLGPKVSAWSSELVEIRSRKLDPRRWSIVVVDDVGVQVGDAPRAAFVDTMRKAGYGEPRAIPDLGRRITSASLQGVALRTAGEVDMVVLVELSSAYASRVGGGRVWYEARGKVRAVNAWREGETFATFALEATASDVGDDRADLAARKKLCADAATKLAAALTERK